MNTKLHSGLLVWSAVASTISIIVLSGLLLWKAFGPFVDMSAMGYLTTEKVSLLDWGLVEVEEALHRADSSLLKKHKPLVFYEKRRIKIAASTAWEPASDKGIAKSWCKDLISEMREFFKVDPNTGKPKLSSSSSVFVYFQHEGYRTSNEPEQFPELLDEIVDLQAVVHIADEEERVECKAPLIGADVKFINQGNDR